MLKFLLKNKINLVYYFNKMELYLVWEVSIIPLNNNNYRSSHFSIDIVVGFYLIKWLFLVVSLFFLMIVGESMADHLTVGFICI